MSTPDEDPDRYVRDLVYEELDVLARCLEKLPIWLGYVPPIDLRSARFRQYTAQVTMGWAHMTRDRPRGLRPIVERMTYQDITAHWLWPFPFQGELSPVEDPVALVAWCDQCVNGKPDLRDIPTRDAWLRALVARNRPEGDESTTTATGPRLAPSPVTESPDGISSEFHLFPRLATQADR